MHQGSDTAATTVYRVADDRRAAAVARVTMGGVRPTAGSAARFVADAAREGTSLEHIWAAAGDGDRLSEVAMILPQPGRTGMLFVSHPTREDRVARLAAVVDRACGALDRSEVTLVQGLVELSEHRQRAAMERAGLTPLAALTYMQCKVRRGTSEPVWAGAGLDVRCESWEPGLGEDFERALVASYEQTRDCPAMRGLREPRDVLAGHRAAGRFEAHLWTLLRVEGDPAGLMLLAPIDATGEVELVYLGVGAGWRRRGLSRYLMGRAMHQCAQEGARTMTLAVDEANGPALDLYQGLGFRATARRMGLMRVIGGREDDNR